MTIKELFYFLDTGHAVGRDAFLAQGIIEPVAKLFDDKEDIARKNAHQAIEMVSETPLGNFIYYDVLSCNYYLIYTM